MKIISKKTEQGRTIKAYLKSLMHMENKFTEID